MRVVRNRDVVSVSKSACERTKVGHLGASHVLTSALTNPIMTSLHVHARTQFQRHRGMLWAATAAAKACTSDKEFTSRACEAQYPRLTSNSVVMTSDGI
mmetsp:Transcript_35724/g.70763  ORF Transcript_35724/g.70763 Transcript_35724/m.70763 type:complete len:99 (-) Transcript_35724:247-543(-)